MGKSKIPDFATVQEESLFWDTHDITEFLDELTPVTLNIQGEIGTLLTFSLDSGELDALMRHARKKGVNVTDLVHSWITERLAIEPE